MLIFWLLAGASGGVLEGRGIGDLVCARGNFAFLYFVGSFTSFGIDS